MTCATVREAEILVQHGFEDILIANEIAGEEKPRQLAELSRMASVKIAVDNSASIRDLAAAQRNAGTQIQILVDVNIGMNRCGVQPDAIAELARYAHEQGLAVRGVMGYDGHLQVQSPSPERDEIVRQGSAVLSQAARTLKGMGLDIGIVSTGGTGTYAVSGDYDGITEIQAGSYLLMDTSYTARHAPFRRALTILSTVISTRGSAFGVLDCGIKAISGERGLPVLRDLPGAQVTALHAEHALVELDPRQHLKLSPGQKVELWVHYSDGTVNLHNCMYGVRNESIEEVFRVEH